MRKGITFSFYFSYWKKTRSYKILIQNGADLTIENKYGKTVLDEVVDKNDGVMIRFLLDNGYSVNHKIV